MAQHREAPFAALCRLSQKAKFLGGDHGLIPHASLMKVRPGSGGGDLKPD
jgi:hypothetical protein